MVGGDVAHWIARHGAPAADLAVRWLRDALAGVQYIHRDVGIVHHDIKPHNLLLDAGQNLRIGDLGLGHVQRLARLALPDGSIRGTLWYMSPEQARGERTDERSDLFSLGSSFYHIVSGMRPFEASTPAEVLARVSRADHEPLATLAPETPALLAVVIDRLMQPHPLLRYQDAGVALADLDSYLASDRPGVGALAAACEAPAPTDMFAQTPSTIVPRHKAVTT
jgi:serine/threonine protein kinase